MSIAHVAAVLERYHGKPHLKLTLLVLADAADSETGECWPSYAAIAGKSGVTRGTAIRNVKQLLDEGVVDRIDRGGFRVVAGGRRVYVSNVYRVRMDVLNMRPHWRELTQDAVEHGSADATVGVAYTPPLLGSADATLTVITEPSTGIVTGDACGETSRDRYHGEQRKARVAVLDVLSKARCR